MSNAGSIELFDFFQRNVIKAKGNSTVALDEEQQVACESSGPKASVILAEDMQRINDALAKIPYEQREVITLHLKAGMNSLPEFTSVNGEMMLWSSE